MREDFLHHVWKFRKFSDSNLQTQQQQSVEIINPGTHNRQSGPDFFAAQLKIDKQVWVGNIEIHIKSSDWYAHYHETDSAYDNVILHVVWEHDTDVYRKDNSVIPTLVLKDKVSKNVLQNYQQLFTQSKKWINCENDFSNTPSFVVQNWIERLYFERLESKSTVVFDLLKTSKNNWEAVLFQLLSKNFGLNTNGTSFLEMATSFPFSVLQKTQHKHTELEALFFGQCGLLTDTIENPYYTDLQERYSYLKKKFTLTNNAVSAPQFFRLRPPNFPTIRLAQLAAVYSQQPQLFSKIIAAKNVEEIQQLFNVTTTSFWDTHYSFTSTSSKRKKKISTSLIDLICINTIAVLKFCYTKLHGKEVSEEITTLLTAIAPEKNSIIKKYNNLKPVATNAMHSQALLQLKRNYCEPNRCLQCAIGTHILDRA